MPPDFRYPTRDHAAWVPLVLQPRELTRLETQNYGVVARLDPRATLEQARRETVALSERLGKTVQGRESAGFAVEPVLDDTVSSVRPALQLLLGAVSLLLLIACVNLSNLFGARAIARRGEFAVRLALGASRARLIGQAIAEAAPVLALGGVLGVGAGRVGGWRIRRHSRRRAFRASTASR